MSLINLKIVLFSLFSFTNVSVTEVLCVRMFFNYYAEKNDSCLLYHVFRIMFMSFESSLLTHVSCLTYLVSCLMPHASCLLFYVSCLTSPVSRLLSHVSCLMSPFSRLLSYASCLTSPVSRLLSHVFCLTASVSRLLFHVSLHMSPFICLLSHVYRQRIGGAVGRVVRSDAGVYGFMSWVGGCGGVNIADDDEMKTATNGVKMLSKLILRCQAS